MGIPERIKELQDELRKTQYNKATEHHFGVVKAKIARLREQMEVQASKKTKGVGFSVRKSGDATVILVGFPSVGKSTLLNVLTGAQSRIGKYEFTTLDVVPGVLRYNHSTIQILDVPGILQGAASGKGRGKEVLSMVRGSDLVIVLIDALQPQAEPVIMRELHEFGVRINQTYPDVKIMKHARGGISISKTVKLDISDKVIEAILREFRINNADILIREKIDIDQLIDVIKRNRHYVPSITVVSKIDLLTDAQRKKLRKKFHIDIEVSAETGENMEKLKELIFDSLSFMRIYLKEINKPPDMKEPMIMKKGSTIGDVCDKIHRTFKKRYRFS
ncbi:OBG GTPase family GTP-binding protein, partial [Nanoarchaeota archaeon]